MDWLIAAYAPSLVVYAAAVRGRGGWITADGLFVAFNSVALIGTAIVADPQDITEREYAIVVAACSSVFAVTAGLLRFGGPGLAEGPIRRRRVIATPISSGFITLYLVALGISVAYYAAIGHITFVDSLSATRAGHAYDAATARLESYAGSQYFFPGYVNQFKNSMLPALSIALIHTVWVQKRPFRLPLSLLVGGTAFVMAAGTGQRGPLILVFVIAVAALISAGLVRGGRLVALLGTGFAIFALLTYALGRNESQLATAQGPSGRIGVLAEALWSRAVLENPISGIAAYHYTHARPVQWGREWGMDIVSLLPGIEGSTLASDVFATLYGSSRGTAPPSLWGSMVYNWSILGAIITAILLAAVLVSISAAMIRRRTCDDHNSEPIRFLELIAWCGLAAAVGSWVAGSPLTVLNQGFFAYLFLILFARRLRNGSSSSSQEQLPLRSELVKVR